jgi:hypothetical protein
MVDQAREWACFQVKTAFLLHAIIIDRPMYQAVQYYDPGNVLIGHTGPACVDKK